jgi:hypothetical protein
MCQKAAQPPCYPFLKKQLEISVGTFACQIFRHSGANNSAISRFVKRAVEKD